MRRYVALLSLMVAPSCVDLRLYDLSVISTQQVTLDHVDLSSLPAQRHVEGRDGAWDVLFIPLGAPTIEGAVDDALTKGGGNLMTNAVFRVRGWTAILFGYRELVAQGDVLDTRTGGAKP